MFSIQKKEENGFKKIILRDDTSKHMRRSFLRVAPFFTHSPLIIKANF